MLDLRDYFDRILVMNLDCCPERWATFEKRMKKAGITGYQRLRAVHGDTCKHPHWWEAGNGAWGCLMSHLRVLQDAMMDDLDNYLILEDDAIPSKDFSKRLPELMKTLEGESWDQLYLGGQHLYRESYPPCPWREGIIRCWNVNRTHAFAVNKQFMCKLSQHIMHFPDYVEKRSTWKYYDETEKVEKDGHFFPHIDHQMGVLHERKQDLIIAPEKWLFGQGANRSNINGKKQKEQWWHDKGWGQ